MDAKQPDETYLLNEVSGHREVLDEMKLEIGPLCSSTSVSRRTSNHNGTVDISTKLFS